MQVLATFIVGAYFLLYALAFPLPLSLSRASLPQFPTLSPPSSITKSTKNLLSSTEAARTYLEESMFAFTTSDKGSSAVRVAISENRPLLGGTQRYTSDEMQKRVKEWMGVLGVERCGDALGCE